MYSSNNAISTRNNGNGSNLPVVQVELRNGKAVVTSLQVAEAFGKQHDNVVRDIRNLLESDDFTRLNFEASSYTDSTGRSLPMFTLTRDGFMLLAMGYNGADAMRLKKAYIAEFNRMESSLQNRLYLPDFSSPADAARAWIAEYEAKTEAQKQLAIAEPKAQVYDSVVADKPMTVARFVRTLRGVNTHQTKGDLQRLGYLYKSGNAYRVYSQFRDGLFEEKVTHAGFMEIMVPDEGKKLLTKLYMNGQLTMKKGFQGALHVGA